MRFAEPSWILVGVFGVILLSLLLVRAERIRTRAIVALVGARLLDTVTVPSHVRRWLRVGLAVFAVAMGFLALARPQVGVRWETLQREGTDLVLVLDASKSMDADDVKPTRLERSKMAIRDLVEKFPGDRVGLVAFAGDALVESPMTLDHDALLDTVGAMDTSVVGRGGTDIGRAIDVASSALASEPDQRKVMVLLTDGEDLAGTGEQAARRARAAGITIHAVGLGTASGELVPAKNEKGETVGVVRDESGVPVRSRLDESALREIVQATGGTYRPLGVDGLGLERLYDEALAPLAHSELAARVRRVYEERFAIPLGLSLGGIVLYALLAWRGRSGSRRSHHRSGAQSAATVAAVLSVAMLPSRAQASVRSAEKAYALGHYEDAARDYAAERGRQPKDARLAYDAGVVAYRAGRYDDAVSALREATALGDPKLQQTALYNEGDAHYRAGEARRESAPEKTIDEWKAAIAAYDGAIALNQNDVDARFNRELVQRKLTELERQQQEQSRAGAKDEKKASGGQGTKGAEDKKKDGKGQPEPKAGQDRQSKTDGQTAAGTSGTQDNHEKTAPSSSPGSNPGETSNNDKQQQPSSSGPRGEQPPRPPSARDGKREPTGDGEARGGVPISGAELGRLSPSEARALLGSLRGEERRGVSRQAGVQAPDADQAPRKDW